MINQHLIEPFARSFRFFEDHDHWITDEVIRPTLRQRFGARLVQLGQQIGGHQADPRLAA
jgi:hypothetical protein